MREIAANRFAHYHTAFLPARTETKILAAGFGLHSRNTRTGIPEKELKPVFKKWAAGFNAVS